MTLEPGCADRMTKRVQVDNDCLREHRAEVKLRTLMLLHYSRHGKG
jgi:hypothetical protein